MCYLLPFLHPCRDQAWLIIIRQGRRGGQPNMNAFHCFTLNYLCRSPCFSIRHRYQLLVNIAQSQKNKSQCSHLQGNERTMIPFESFHTYTRTSSSRIRACTTSCKLLCNRGINNVLSYLSWLSLITRIPPRLLKWSTNNIGRARGHAIIRMLT